MDAWVVWVIVAVIFALGEISTLSFYLAPFSVGALVAAGTSAAGGGDVIPWLVFIVVSLLALAIVRPIARQHRRTPALLRSGTAALVGRSGLVVQAIGGAEHVGQVKIDGEVWTAKGYEGEDFAEGQTVHVVEIKGATALVTE
jgi:membrane protein implicated in regulation of membrane protease activity